MADPFIYFVARQVTDVSSVASAMHEHGVDVAVLDTAHITPDRRLEFERSLIEQGNTLVYFNKGFANIVRTGQVTPVSSKDITSDAFIEELRLLLQGIPKNHHFG